MATVDNILSDIDKRLKDPNSLTPSMSFCGEEMKNYADLFKGTRDYSMKTWEPAISLYVLKESAQNYKLKVVDSTKERKKLEERLKSYKQTQKKPTRPLGQSNHLYKQAAMLNRKRENLRIQQQKAEKKQLYSPIILQKSREMLKDRSGKIEDRLLATWKSQKEASEQFLRESSSQSRIPTISPYATQIQTEKPVMDRLMLYSKIYHEKKKRAQETPPECSFTPKINSYSNSVSRSDLYSPKINPVAECQYSFKPELNQNSLKIAEKLGPFGCRTSSRSSSYSKSVGNESYLFRPQINKNYSISSFRSGSPRWKQLYDMNLDRRERLEMLRKAFADNERDFECTFHPKTCRPLNSLSTSGTVERLNSWESKRQASINAKKDSISDKDLDECTFKPFLYGSISGQTTLTDFYSELDRKKKKTYSEIHKGKFTPDKIEWKNDKVAPLFISDINSNEYDDAIKELHDLLHIGLK
ncbi:hypothetical protein SteCoe_24456 [Stentor coeruleus]|uniref:Uncharacterized protein n=1 Tax=Stentor coeruleus TaxID=5963 RepID=A0A1R2BHM7_9CILI|nr:hypothetical protein SteCoe_24456 [Stentor coeruleus]